FHVVVADGVAEDGQQVIDADARWAQAFAIVEGRMDLPGVDDAVAIAEVIAADAGEREAPFAVPLQDGDAVGMPFEKQIDGMAAELVAVEAVEEDGPAAALRVADFTNEDGGAGRLVPPLAGEVAVAQ